MKKPEGQDFVSPSNVNILRAREKRTEYHGSLLKHCTRSNAFVSRIRDTGDYKKAVFMFVISTRTKKWRSGHGYGSDAQRTTISSVMCSGSVLFTAFHHPSSSCDFKVFKNRGNYQCENYPSPIDVIRMHRLIWRCYECLMFGHS